jgi:hypothetical protein
LRITRGSGVGGSHDNAQGLRSGARDAGCEGR